MPKIKDFKNKYQITSKYSMQQDDLKNVSNNLLPDGWLSLDNIPPDKLVEVIDAKGNIAQAYPTWYPFKVVPNPNKVGKWTSDVVPCEPYWDGGWMIECEGLISNMETVIGWRYLQ